MTRNSPQLLSVQVGGVRRTRLGGRSLLTALVKRPVHGPVPVGPLGLAGDEQADLAIHGGLGKAVCAYPAERLTLSGLEPGTLCAGQAFELIPGPRSIGIPELFAAQRVKHLRGEP